MFSTKTKQISCIFKAELKKCNFLPFSRLVKSSKKTWIEYKSDLQHFWSVLISQIFPICYMNGERPKLPFWHCENTCCANVFVISIWCFCIPDSSAEKLWTANMWLERTLGLFLWCNNALVVNRELPKFVLYWCYFVVVIKSTLENNYMLCFFGV